ncbi:3'-5' exonuclease, partial [Streptomyces sp. NPDC059003]|uniref:3'-5' exonuclease n=1 Tax=Streptomyces sp. NPDC059003 TaxID=3346691 RepID=UPI0036A86071
KARAAIEEYLTAHTPEPEPGQGGIVSEYQNPDITISTAHKSKGLEWPRVRIASDFLGPESDQAGKIVWDTTPDDEMLRLSYVAVTRPTQALDIGSLGWSREATATPDPLVRPTGVYRRPWTTADFHPDDPVLYEAEDGSVHQGIVLRTEPPFTVVIRNTDTGDAAGCIPEQVLRRKGKEAPQLPVATDAELDQALAEGRYQPPHQRPSTAAPPPSAPSPHTAEPAAPAAAPAAPNSASGGHHPSAPPSPPARPDTAAPHDAQDTAAPAPPLPPPLPQSLLALYDLALNSTQPVEAALRTAAARGDASYTPAFDAWFTAPAAHPPPTDAERETLRTAIALASRPVPPRAFPDRATARQANELLAQRATQWIAAAGQHLAVQHRTFKAFTNAWKSVEADPDHGPLARAARHTRTLLGWTARQHPDAPTQLRDGLATLHSQASQLLQRWDQPFDTAKLSSNLHSAAQAAEPYGGPATPFSEIAHRLVPDRDHALRAWHRLRTALHARVPPDDPLLLETDVLTRCLTDHDIPWHAVATGEQSRLLARRIADRDPYLHEACAQYDALAWTYLTRLSATLLAGVTSHDLLVQLGKIAEAGQAAADTTKTGAAHLAEPGPAALILRHRPSSIPLTSIEQVPDDAAEQATALGFQPAATGPSNTFALPDHWSTALRGRRAQALAHALRQAGHPSTLIDDHPTDTQPAPPAAFSGTQDHAQAHYTAAAAVVQWSRCHRTDYGSDTPRDDEDWHETEWAAWQAARTTLASLAEPGPEGEQTAPVRRWRELLRAAETLDTWNHLGPSKRATATLIEAVDLYLARLEATTEPALRTPPAPHDALLQMLGDTDARHLLERPTPAQRRTHALTRVSLGQATSSGRRTVHVDGAPSGHHLVDDLHGFVLHHDNGAISDPYDTQDEALYDAVRAADRHRSSAAEPAADSPHAPAAETSTVPGRADVPRWAGEEPQIAPPQDAEPLPGHPGYLHHADPETGTIAVFAQGRFIGHAEPFTTARAQTRYRTCLGDDQLFNGRSPADAAGSIASTHAALTGPLPPRAQQPEEVWVEHHEQCTRIHGSKKDDAELRAALQLAGPFRPIYERTAGRKTFQYWAVSSKQPPEIHAGAVERLVALLAARGRTLAVETTPRHRAPATAASASASAALTPSAATPEIDTSNWPEGAEPVPDRPGFWLWWEPAREWDPTADYHDFTRYVRIGHGASVIARATSPRHGKKWTLIIGGDHLPGATTIEATAHVAVRHWQLLHAPAADAVPARDAIWVEHNETTTIVHGFSEGDEQAWAALRLADFGRVAKSDTIGLPHIRGKPQHAGTRRHKTSLLVGALARVGRIVEVHPNPAAREAALAEPTPPHLTSQDRKQLEEAVRESAAQRRWSSADFAPGDDVLVRSCSYWRRVEQVTPSGLALCDGDDTTWREVLAQWRKGQITRADSAPSTDYARPLTLKISDLEDEDITAELASLERPAARPEHAPLISDRRDRLQAEADSRRGQATEAESQRAVFAQYLDTARDTEQDGICLVHDEGGTLLGAVVTAGRGAQFINRDGYLRGHAHQQPALAQDALFKELEDLEAAAPNGWRPAAFATLTPGESIRLPHTRRSWGSRSIEAQPGVATEPFTYTAASRTPAGQLTITGEKDGEQVQHTLTPDAAALGAQRPAHGAHAFTDQHRILHVARTRIRRALNDAPPGPITGASAWNDVRATAATVLRRPVTPAELAARLPQLAHAVNAFAQKYVSDRSPDTRQGLTALAEAATSLAAALQHNPSVLVADTDPPPRPIHETEAAQQLLKHEESQTAAENPAEAGRRRAPLPIGTRPAAEMTEQERIHEETGLKAYRRAMDHSTDPGTVPDGAVSPADLERRTRLNARHREIAAARHAARPALPTAPHQLPQAHATPEHADPTPEDHAFEPSAPVPSTRQVKPGTGPSEQPPAPEPRPPAPSDAASGPPAPPGAVADASEPRQPAAFTGIDAAREHLAAISDKPARSVCQSLDMDKGQLTADGTFLIAKSTSTDRREGIRHKGRWYIVHARTAVVVSGYDGDTRKTSAQTYAGLLATATDSNGTAIPWGELTDRDAVTRARTDTRACMEVLTAQENDRQAEADDAQRASARSVPGAFAQRADMVAHWCAGGRYPADDTGTGAFMRYWSSAMERQTLHLSADGQFALLAFRTGWEVFPAADALRWGRRSLTFTSRDRAETFAAHLAALRRAEGTAVNWTSPDMRTEVDGFVSDQQEPFRVAVLRAYAATYADGKGIPQGVNPAKMHQEAAQAAANSGAGQGRKFAEDLTVGDLLDGELPRRVTAVEDLGRMRRIHTCDGAADDYAPRATVPLFTKDPKAAAAAIAFDGTAATRLYTAELGAGDVVEFEIAEDKIRQLANAEPGEIRHWNGHGTWRVIGVVVAGEAPGTPHDGPGVDLDQVRVWRRQYTTDGTGLEEHTPGTRSLRLGRDRAPGIVRRLDEHTQESWSTHLAHPHAPSESETPAAGSTPHPPTPNAPSTGADGGATQGRAAVGSDTRPSIQGEGRTQETAADPATEAPAQPTSPSRPAGTDDIPAESLQRETGITGPGLLAAADGDDASSRGEGWASRSSELRRHIAELQELERRTNTVPAAGIEVGEYIRTAERIVHRPTPPVPEPATPECKYTLEDPHVASIHAPLADHSALSNSKPTQSANAAHALRDRGTGHRPTEAPVLSSGPRTRHGGQPGTGQAPLHTETATEEPAAGEGTGGRPRTDRPRHEPTPHGARPATDAGPAPQPRWKFRDAPAQDRSAVSAATGPHQESDTPPSAAPAPAAVRTPLTPRPRPADPAEPVQHGLTADTDAAQDAQASTSGGPAAPPPHRRSSADRGGTRRRPTAPVQQEGLFPADGLSATPSRARPDAAATARKAGDTSADARPVQTRGVPIAEAEASADDRRSQAPTPDSQRARTLLGPDFTGLSINQRTSTDTAEASRLFSNELRRHLDAPEPVPGPQVLCHLGRQPVYFAALDHPTLGRVVDMGIDPTQRPIARVTRDALDTQPASVLLSGLINAAAPSAAPTPSSLHETDLRQRTERLMSAQQQRLNDQARAHSGPSPRPSPATSQAAPHVPGQASHCSYEQASAGMSVK